jgi:SAM-dependent methyltransferase
MSAMVANPDMAQAWDGPEGSAWSAQAVHYERSSRRFWARFLAAVSVAADERVLDVGCGNGKSTCELASLASGGSAVGIDLSGQMLANARERASGARLANVSFLQGDAQIYPFEPASSTLASSLFGAMFFADPVAAFANIGAALVPNGRLALLAWRELARNEWITVFRESLAAGRELPTPPVSVPGPFGLADRDRASAVLTDAGFADVSVEAVDETVDMGADADEAFAFMSSLGVARGLMQDLDEAARADGLDRLRRAIADHATSEGVLFQGSAWLITARWVAATR